MLGCVQGSIRLLDLCLKIRSTETAARNADTGRNFVRKGKVFFDASSNAFGHCNTFVNRCGVHGYAEFFAAITSECCSSADNSLNRLH